MSHGTFVPLPCPYGLLLPLGPATNIELTDHSVRVLFCGLHRALLSPRGGDLECLEAPVRSLYRLWSEDSGQDVAEYAVMLAVILVIVVGTIRLIGGNANNVFSSVASSITQ
jgi:Flp pilus assembly pilin Flp